MKNTPRFIAGLASLLATVVYSAPFCLAQDVLLDAQIRLCQARLQQLSAQFQQVDADTENNVRQVLQMLLPLKDSLESHDKVAIEKKKVIGDLKESLDFYASERSKRDADLARLPGAAARERLVKEIEALDGRVNLRAAEIIKLTSSLVEHPNVKQYQTYYAENAAGWVFPSQQVTLEYDQNRAVSMVSKSIHQQLMDGL
jgi:ATP-dependent Clp protease ATP-binding subunit ClpA